MPQTLSARQTQFVKNYVKGMPLVQAAITAGYAERSAHTAANRLIKNDDVLEAINVAKNKAHKAPSVNAAWVTSQFLKIAKRARKAEQYGPWHKAVESIGKHLGYFELDNSQRSPVIIIGGRDEPENRAEKLARELVESERRQAIEAEAVDAQYIESRE